VENNTKFIQENTLDIRDLFTIFKKRKKLIWSITGIFTLIAIVYTIMAKPVYEVKSMIEIGQIDGKPLDDINDIKQKLSYQYKINTKGIEKELPRVESISIPKNSKGIFSLSIDGYSNDEAIKYIQTVISHIENTYQDKIKAYISSQKELITNIQKDIQNTTKTLQSLTKELNNYSQRMLILQEKDPTLSSIYAMQIAQSQTQLIDLQNLISELKNKEQELKLSLTPVKMKPTKVVGEIEVLENPIKPKKKLIIIVAFITGIMFSVFLVFFLELIGKKEEDTEA
jgi:uncharacterized protein involved in exopolysaccharide biosynthesis